MGRFRESFLNHGRSALAVSAILGVLGVLAVGHVLFAASEADWFYQAAALQARFEKISSAQVPWADKAKDYYALLDDVKKFDSVGDVGQAPSPVKMDVAQPPPAVMNREGRGRHAFALLCTGWIQQMLADSEAAKRTEGEYKAFIAAMPEEERAIATGFFEKQYQKSPVCMPRVCNVEARGKEIRVNAVDWPLRDLLDKAADATGDSVSVPKGVDGLVDCHIQDWCEIGKAIRLFLHARGLDMGGRSQNVSASSQFTVWLVDPLFGVSIGERADQRKRLQALQTPKTGISRGIAFINGWYIAPPYDVQVKTEEGEAVVCINGISVTQRRPSTKPTFKPVLPIDSAPTRDLLYTAIEHRYDDLLPQVGDAVAKQTIVAELKRNPLVAKARPTTDCMVLTLVGRAREVPVLLRAFRKSNSPMDVEKKATEAAERDKESIADALRANSLLIFSGESALVQYPANDAMRVIGRISSALWEVTRIKDGLARDLYGDRDWQNAASQAAWDLLLNAQSADLIGITNGFGSVGN